MDPYDAVVMPLQQLLIIHIQLCDAENADMEFESAQLLLANCSDSEGLPQRHSDYWVS